MKELILKVKDEDVVKELLDFLKKFGKKVEIREKQISEEDLKKMLGIDEIKIDTTKYKFYREEAHER